MRRIRWLGVPAALSLMGCATGAYMGAGDKLSGQNPHAALEYYSLALKSSPGDKAILDKIDGVAKQIADKHNTFVQGAKRSKKFDTAVADCDRMIATQSALSKGSSGVQILHDREERTQMATLAAKKHYDKGVGQEEGGSFKKAAVSYRRALGFVAGYEDADARYAKALENASVKLGFLRFDARDNAGPDLAQKFRAELKQLLSDLNPEFVRAVDGQPTGKGTKHFLRGMVTGKFGDTNWESQAQQNSGSFERDTGEVDANGMAITEWYEITATWVVHTRTTSADLELQYKIVAEDQAQISNGLGTVSMSDTSQYVSDFGGDVNDPNYQSLIPADVQNLPGQPREPANFNRLAAAAAQNWGAKGQPVYKFARTIFKKYK